MSDRSLRELERSWRDTREEEAGRRLLHALERGGGQDELTIEVRLALEQSRFYEPVFAVLGRRLKFLAEWAARLRRLEADRGLRLPAAVREWWSLEGAGDVLAGRDAQPGEVVGLPPWALDEAGLLGQGGLTLPAGLLETLVQVREGDERRWAARVQDPVSGAPATREDPEVVLEAFFDGSWHPHAASFSEFVLSRCWDGWHLGELGVFGHAVGVPDEEVLVALGVALGLGPRTERWPDEEVLRFGAGPARVSLARLRGGYGSWRLAARGPARLAALVEQVQDCGVIVNAAFVGLDDASEEVLRQVRLDG